MEEAPAASYGGAALNSELNFESKISYEAKLKELLHRITSPEIKLCSSATKEFKSLLKTENGSILLRGYVTASPKCSELIEAWKLRQGKARDLDKFARLIVTDYLNDLYKELNRKELKRQKAVLLLLAPIVRRGNGLSNEVAKSFDFKVSGFAELEKRRKECRKSAEGKRKKKKRRSAVWLQEELSLGLGLILALCCIFLSACYFLPGTPLFAPN